MITIFIAIILGVVQGITEFLPISSTAHLTLVGKLLGLIDPARPQHWTAFIAIIQLGTVAAVIIYFFREILAMLASLLADWKHRSADEGIRWSRESRLAGLMIVGTLPVALIGLTFKSAIEGTFTKEISTIATSLIVLAVLLLLAEVLGKRNRALTQATWLDALIVGFAQACALIPGSSRSGTTITAGLFLGMEREAAARFSFLLSIPAVIASGLFELYEARHFLGSVGIFATILSTIVSGVVGYLAIGLLLRYLKTHSTTFFIIYRILLGGALWFLLIEKII